MNHIRVQNYRRYAADCLERAAKTDDDADQRRLINMAAGWHELATTLEDYMDEHDGQEPPSWRVKTPSRGGPEPRH